MSICTGLTPAPVLLFLLPTYGVFPVMSVARFTLAVALVASVAAGVMSGRGAVAAEGVPPAPVPLPLPAADPSAFVSAWLDGLRRNDLAVIWNHLPPTRQVDLAAAWQASVGKPDRFRDLLLDRQLGALSDPTTAKESARLLASGLAQFGRIASGAPPTPQPAPAEGQRPDRMQMMPVMLATNALTGMVQGVLADGLETRQVDCFQGLFADYAVWASTAGLDDVAKHEVAVNHLVAFATALGMTKAADLATVDLAQMLTRLGSGLPSLKLALFALGLDPDAVLASATVAVEPATDESGSGEQRTVVLLFTAFAKPRELPLKLKRGAAGDWSLLADSPVARWLRPAQRWSGGGRQGRPGAQSGGGAEGSGPGTPPAGGPAGPAPGNNTF